MGATAFDQTPSPQSSANLAGLIPAANLLINSDWRINQRAYVSAAALAVGIYGHDRWKAGAAGGDYSFTQLASSTTITIASGKSLIQVVEDKNVEGGSYVLSWVGTALARVGINSATPSGAYAASPILITGQTAGTTMSVEMGPGTVGKAKLELGAVPTQFVMSDIVSETVKCRRTYRTGVLYYDGYATANTSVGMTVVYDPPMRATPTLAFTNFNNLANAYNPATRASSSTGFGRYVLGVGAGGTAASETFTAEAEL